MIRKKIIYYVLLIIILTGINGKSQWISVDNGSSGNLREIKFKDENTGWYISDYKYIYKTTNAGLNWQGIDIPNIDSLNNLSGLLCQSDTLWICTNENRLIKSTNGGNNWVEIWVTNCNNILNLQYIKSDLIYGLTYHENNIIKLVKSTNGGFNWIQIYQFPFQMSYSEKGKYQFLNDTLGFSLGSQCIAKTTNGGYNWNIVYIDTGSINNVYFDYMKFINSETGFLVKNLWFLYITTDGGYNWQYHGNYRLSEIVFKNIDEGYLIIGGPNYFYKTTNGGVNWVIKYFNEYSEFKDLEVVNNTLYIAASYGGTIFKSINCGDNWTNISVHNTFFTLKTIDFINLSTGFTGGNKSGILQTTNGGINWYENESFKKILNSNNRDIKKIQFTDQNTGWVITDTGFYKTTNAGDDWYYFPLNLNRTSNFCFFNNNTGWLVCDTTSASTHHIIYKTTTGGYEWNFQYYASITGITDIEFLDSLYGFITFNDYFTGENLLRTTNGGINWQLLNVGSFYSVCIVDRNNAYLGGDGNGILKTTNGGDNWTDVFPYKYGWTDVKFINQKTGFASNYGKNIFYSTNEGNNWAYLNIGSSTDIHDMFFNVNGFGIIVGGTGKIYRTTNFGGIVGIGNQNQTIPTEFELFQNYPNPFNQFSIINYKCSIGGMVKIAVYDLLGREVVELVNEYKPAGTYSIKFDASDLTSGIYFYKIQTDKWRKTKKMAVIK